MTTRLSRELALLYAVEAAYKIPAAPIVRQLVEWEERLLPDAIPPVPRWTAFDWPMSGSVNFEGYWREVDGGRSTRWAEPYL